MLKVSCVMPTKDRREFIPAAIDCFLRQTYENRELVIVDDGDDPVGDLAESYKDRRIRYFRTDKMLTGPKRNFTNSLAEGTLIAHFDDDDWSSDDRIEFQVAFMEEQNKKIAGFSRLLFWDCLKKRPLFYRAFVPNYVVGTSLVYWKAMWEMHPFAAEQVATDHKFVNGLLTRIAASPDHSHMVARIHGNHTSGKENIRETIGRDAFPNEFWENERLRNERL